MATGVRWRRAYDGHVASINGRRACYRLGRWMSWRVVWRQTSVEAEQPASIEILLIQRVRCGHVARRSKAAGTARGER